MPIRALFRRARWIRFGSNHWLYYKGGASIVRINADRGRQLRSFVVQVRHSTVDPVAQRSLSSAKDLAEAMLVAHGWA